MESHGILSFHSWLIALRTMSSWSICAVAALASLRVSFGMAASYLSSGSECELLSSRRPPRPLPLVLPHNALHTPSGDPGRVGAEPRDLCPLSIDPQGTGSSAFPAISQGPITAPCRKSRAEHKQCRVNAEHTFPKIFTGNFSQTLRPN